MKRSPLVRRTALRAAAALKRTRRPKRMSSKHQLFNAELNAMKPYVYIRSGGLCEARTSACTGFGQHVHHRMGRRVPGANRLVYLLHVCDACHRYVHGHPLESYQQGWLLSRVARSAPERPVHGAGIPPSRPASSSPTSPVEDPAAGSGPYDWSIEE